jgi:uncharacterized protein (DUF1501 family)
MPTRRQFLSRLCFGQQPHVTDAGGHTLVCVFLRGGADTLNLVVPHGDDEYYRSRPTLAIARPGKGENATLPLPGEKFFGFHPKMKPLLKPFEEGRLGIVQAVGTDNPTGSHFEAQDQIEHGEGYRAAATIGGGWLGRYLRTRTAHADSPLAGVAIAPTLPEALRGAPAASAFSSLDEIHVPAAGPEADAVTRALASMYASEVGLLGQQGKETLELLKKVQTLRDKPYVPEAGAEYPDVPFGHGLREIARLVKADVGLEVACLDLQGWDTHFFQGTIVGQLTELTDALARGLAAFDADLASHRPRVTTVVMTEFGRRLYENGSAGTDHGRGFAMMAFGDSINGGKVLGQWPGFEQDPIFPGPGGLQVKTDYRSILAEVLRGPMKCEAIDKVFPGFTPEQVGLVKA